SGGSAWRTASPRRSSGRRPPAHAAATFFRWIGNLSSAGGLALEIAIGGRLHGTQDRIDRFVVRAIDKLLDPGPGGGEDWLGQVPIEAQYDGAGANVVDVVLDW